MCFQKCRTAIRRTYYIRSWASFEEPLAIPFRTDGTRSPRDGKKQRHSHTSHLETIAAFVQRLGA
jgi:hypothetical protein